MASPLTKPSAMKRSKSFSLAGQSVSFAPNKRVCIAPEFGRRNSATVAALFNNNSSSEEDDDSDDDEACYLNNQRRAKKRAYSMRKSSISMMSNDRLNLAISQYSDIDDDGLDDEDDEEKEKKETKDEVQEGSVTDKKNELVALVPPSPPSTKVEKVLESLSRRDSTVGGFSSDGKSQLKRSAQESDRIARNRCFEYLVSAIDEAWAQFCDATSYAEDEVYNNVDYLPNTPASLGLSDNDDDSERDDDDEGYKSSHTNLTEYDSEVETKRVSGQPSSVRLQQLKDRLLKAKYYLQDYLEVDDVNDAMVFWKRWDLVKYATIELVEDDDDDEVIESTIEDLEKGRLYGCY